VRIARVFSRTSAQPRVALERDGALYDVEELERVLGEAVPIPGHPWDFHTRVIALGCAGLAELDRLLVMGERPSCARLDPSELAWLAPLDVERASYVRFEPRTRAVSIGHGPSLVGQDALVDPVRGEGEPTFSVGVGVVVAEELSRATVKECRGAIAGLSVLVAWGEAGARDAGLRAQLGPVLVPPGAVGAARALSVRAQVGDRALPMGTLGELGVSVEEALAAASAELVLRAGDLVEVGPLPSGSPAVHGVALTMHERVAVTIERLGTLRGAAVPRR
jgi:hypothetical protein